jgi:parvulin-like peptidyl-prolyl isomerase
MNLAENHEDPDLERSAPEGELDGPAERPDEIGLAGTPEQNGTVQERAEALSPEPEEEDGRFDDDDEALAGSGSSSLGVLKGVILGVVAALIVGGVAFAMTVNRNSSSKPTPAAVASTPAAVPTQPAAAAPAVSGGAVAAVVNGHNIPMSTFRTLLGVEAKQNAQNPQAAVSNPVLGQQVMNQVVADEVIRQYAAAHHISVSSSALNQRVLQIEQQSGGATGFKSQLAQFGLTMNQYKQLISPSLLDQQVEQKVVPLSAATTTTAHVRHILIGVNLGGKHLRSDAAAKARAQMVFAKLQHGASFASLVKKYTDDTGSKNTGGVYDVQPGQMVAQFQHAAFTLPLNKPTIIHTQFGYHIIEVLSRGKAPSAQLQQQKFSAWVTKQVKSAKVKKLATVK